VRRFLATVTILSVGCVALGHLDAMAQQKRARQEPMLAHNVFFSLKDNSEVKKKELVADCHVYLAPVDGIVFYAAGVVSELRREVNDRDYDVALHIVFKNRAALDRYMTAPNHLRFIKKHKENWKKVRVFDSCVSGAK